MKLLTVCCFWGAVFYMTDFGVVPVLAQTVESDEVLDEARDSSMLFTVEYSIGTQSVRTGRIPLYVYITPDIDSTKAQIMWDIPRGVIASDPVEEWFEMKTDETKMFVINVIPERSGSYKIVVDVTAWRYDTNYVNSIEVELEIDEDLHLTPVTEEYTKRLMIYNVVLVAGGIIMLGLAGICIKFMYKRFKQWMDQD